MLLSCKLSVKPSNVSLQTWISTPNYSKAQAKQNPVPKLCRAMCLGTVHPSRRYPMDQQTASQCDSTGCRELSAQLPPKQEGPALPSLLPSQDDAPPPVSPPALWSFSASSFNSLQQILQHFSSLNQHITGSRKFWLLQGGSGRGMEWGGKEESLQ